MIISCLIIVYVKNGGDYMVENIKKYEQLFQKLKQEAKTDIGIRTKQPLEINQQTIDFLKANVGKKFPIALIKELLGMAGQHKDKSGNVAYRLNRYFRNNGIEIHAGTRDYGKNIAFNQKKWE